MKVVGCIILIACLAASPYMCGQATISLSQQDLDAAQAVYWSLTVSAYQTLHEAPIAFPDGARGYVIKESYRDGSHYGDYTGDSAHDSLMLARNEYCRASLVVLGRATGVEQVVLSPNQEAIFTATQFKIERILKDGGASHVGDAVTYMYPGGTLKQVNGVVLRTQLEGKPLRPFKRNALYLLRLDKANGNKYPSTAYFSIDTHQIKIVDGHVYSTKRTSDAAISNPVRYGESFTAYWKRVSGFLATHPCPANP